MLFPSAQCSWVRGQLEDHLYEANSYAAKIFEWKRRILREENQDQCKRRILDASKGGWVHHFQSLSLSLSLGGESSTELVSVATEPLTSASQLHVGWTLHKRGASARFSEKVRQYFTKKFHIGRDTGRK